jgi:nucleoside-diphosphate-sugar epimerase
MSSFWKGKKVLVTGGAGFIGSHLSKALVKNGAELTISVSSHTSSEKIAKNLGEMRTNNPVVRVDILSQSACDKIVRGHDAIFHMAALDGGTAYKLAYPADIFQQNVQMTLNILESAKKHNLKRVFLMSSIELYPVDAISPMDETILPFERLTDKRFGYAWSKRFLEIAAFFYAKQYDLPIAIARAGNVYGPNDQKDSGRVIPTFIQKIAKGEDVILWGDGQQRRSFLYVSDFVDAAITLSEKYAVCDPVNIASERVISMKELSEMIGRIMKKRIKISYKPAPSNIAEDRIASVEKAKKCISFQEKKNLEDGLSDTVASFIKK